MINKIKNSPRLFVGAKLDITIKIVCIPRGNRGDRNALAERFPGMQLAEPLLIEEGYNAKTELGRISSIIRRVTDDFDAAKSE